MVSQAIQLFTLKDPLADLVGGPPGYPVVIFSITPKAAKTPSDTWHHLLPLLPNLSGFSCQNQPQLFPLAAKPTLAIPHLY